MICLNGKHKIKHTNVLLYYMSFYSSTFYELLVKWVIASDETIDICPKFFNFDLILKLMRMISNLATVKLSTGLLSDGVILDVKCAIQGAQGLPLVICRPTGTTQPGLGLAYCWDQYGLCGLSWSGSLSGLGNFRQNWCSGQVWIANIPSHLPAHWLPYRNNVRLDL